VTKDDIVLNVLDQFPNRGWGVIITQTPMETLIFTLLLASGHIKAQSVSGLPETFQARLTGQGRRLRNGLRAASQEDRTD
jgi:hypothetical protein